MTDLVDHIEIRQLEHVQQRAAAFIRTQLATLGSNGVRTNIGVPAAEITEALGVTATADGSSVRLGIRWGRFSLSAVLGPLSWPLPSKVEEMTGALLHRVLWQVLGEEARVARESMARRAVV